MKPTRTVIIECYKTNSKRRPKIKLNSCKLFGSNYKFHPYEKEKLSQTYIYKQK